MSQLRQGILAVLLLLALLISAAPVKAQASLYERLGGQEAIQAVVDELVKNLAADERINQFFINLGQERLDRLNRLLVEQICQATGGPCTYSGRSMLEAHMGLGLSDADFDALVEDLVKALNTFNVPEQEQNELLSLLGPMRSDIVEESAPPTTMPTTGNSLYELSTWLGIAVVFGFLVAASWWERKRSQAA